MQVEDDGSNGSAPLPTPIVCDLCAAPWQSRGGFVAVRRPDARVWHCFECFDGTSAVSTAAR